MIELRSAADGVTPAFAKSASTNCAGDMFARSEFIYPALQDFGIKTKNSIASFGVCHVNPEQAAKMGAFCR